MGANARRPDRARVFEKIDRWQGLAEQWSPLFKVPGNFTSCDLYFQGVGADYALLQIRIFAVSGSIRVPLVGPTTIQNAQSMWKDQAGGVWSGLVASVRGRQCDGFEVEATGVAASSAAKWRLETWYDGGETYSDDAGRIMVDPWGIDGNPTAFKFTRYACPATGIPLAVTTVTGVPDGAAWDLIWANSTSNGGDYVFTLQTNGPLGVLHKLSWIQHIYFEWTYEGAGVPGDLDASWELVIPAAAITHGWFTAEFRRRPAYANP